MKEPKKPNQKLNFNHLYYFYVTVKCEGVTKAAAVLGLSQPSLSSQLKDLGERINTQLFIKKGRINVLTTEGKNLYKHVEEMYDIAKVIEEQFCPDPITHTHPKQTPLSPELASRVQAEVRRVLKQKYKL